MATPENRLAGLEERIMRRRERNVRLAQRLERRQQDRALEAAGVNVPRLEFDPETGGIRRGDLAPRSVVERDQLPVVAREQARQRIIRGEVPELQTVEQQREAVRQLTPRTGDLSQNVTEADEMLASARPVERFIARQQAFTPLGGLSKAVESVGGLASFAFDPLDFTGVRRGIRRRRELERATEQQPEFQDLASRLASVGSDFVQVGGELVALRRVPRIGPALAGEVTPVGRTVTQRIGSRAAIEGAAGAGVEGAVAIAEGEDLETVNRRMQFGGAAGAAIGTVIGGVTERLAARRAAAEAARTAEAAERNAIEETQQVLADAFAEGGRIGPERQLTAGAPETPTGAIRLPGETASMRERLRARARASRAQEALPPPEAGVRVEGLTEVAERAIRQGEVPGAPARASSATRPPPPSETQGVVRSLRRRLADAIDPQRARELEEAYTDRLTGLRNQDAWRRAQVRLEADRGTELVLIDLRNFKGVNDLVSMKAGDQKLTDVADVIRQVAADEVGARNLFRAGGDEFLIAAPRGQGARIGREIVRRVGDTPIADTELTFGARFGVGPTFDAADAAAKKAKIEETGARFREGVQASAEGSPVPTAAQPRSINENMSRSVQVRRQRQRRVASEPQPTGRPPNRPPADATKGPDGPVDFEVDPKTGKEIPNQRTVQARQKSAFTDSGEGGYLVDPRRDALEATPERNLQPHEKRVQSQISVGEGQSWIDRLPSLNDLYTMLVRRTAGIERANRVLGGEGKSAIDDTAVAAHLASGSERRAEAFLEYGPGRWTVDGQFEATGTPGITEILAPMRGKLNQLRRYLIAARAMEVGQRDIKTGITLDDAQRIVSEAPEEIKQAQRQIVAYLRDVARYYADAAGIPEERLQAMFALGEDYVPLTRVFEGRDPISSQGTGVVGRAGEALRRLRGSERPIQDPIESIVDYTKRMIRAADINRIGTNLVNAAEAAPERSVGLLARIERPPVSQVTQAAERLQRAAEARGARITAEEATELAEALGADNLNIADDVIRVWQDGDLVAYRVAPSIARGIRALQPRDLDPFVKLLGLIPRTLKAGVTLNPGFQVFNLIRDSFDAAVQSDFGFRLGVDSFRGFYESVKAQWMGRPSEIYQEFARAGGGFASFRGQTRRGVQQQVRMVLPQVETRTGRVFDVATMPLRHPVQMLKDFAAPFEEAARVAEFMRAKSAGANAIDAVLASKKVTVDFQNMGSAMQGFSYMTAFLNAGIQSLDTAFRVGVRPITRARQAETAVEAATTLTLEAAKVYGMAVGAISLPSMYFWAASRGDVEVEDLRKSEAGLIYWFVRDPQGEIIRIPKPFMWGQIFGTGMEAVLDQMADEDPQAMERWGQGIRDMAWVNMVPNAIQIPIEQFANKSIAFGTPIVPQELERVEPRMQATERTSRLARKLGEITNVSPARIDKVMRDIGGTLPADLLRWIDQSIDRYEGDAITEPASTKSDIAFFGRFFQRDPSLSVESVQNFWESAIAAEEAMNTFRLLEERGDEVGLSALFDRRFEDFAVAAVYEGSRREISEIRNAIDAIRVMPDDMFQPDEDPGEVKREMIDELLRQYIEIARVTNEVAADILRAEEQASVDTSLQPAVAR